MAAARPIWDRIKPALKPAAFGACGIVSLIVIALWIRSYSKGERYRIVTGSVDGAEHLIRSYTFNSSAGGLQLMYVRLWTDSQQSSIRLRNERKYLSPGYSTLRDLVYPIRGADDSVISSLGFQTATARGRSDEGWRETLGWVTIPYWFILSLACAYPLGSYARAVLRRQREERIALGLCPRCGEPVDDSLVRCRGCDKPVAILSEA